MWIQKKTIPPPVQFKPMILKDQQEKGITLMEAMITIAIMAILLSIAVPSYQYLFGQKYVDSYVSALNKAVQLAKSEALRRNTNCNKFQLKLN